MQWWVNERPHGLNAAIQNAFGFDHPIHWVSPLASHRYQEYRDAAFLRAVGKEEYKTALSNFWPNGGPVWDALATVQSEGSGVLLVEAKSHVQEIYGGGCKATPISLAKITHALDLTKAWLGVPQQADWLGTSEHVEGNRAFRGSLYQMANRLAHLYFFREVIGVDAWMANLYFVDDPRTPTSVNGWTSALAETKAALGLSDVPFGADILLKAMP